MEETAKLKSQIPDDVYQRIVQRWENGELRAIDDGDRNQLLALDPTGNLLSRLVMAWDKDQEERRTSS